MTKREKEKEREDEEEKEKAIPTAESERRCIVRACTALKTIQESVNTKQP